MKQLVWVCDRYELADDNNSEVPNWPVQDEGGHWHREEFPGQRVAYDRAHVNFGIRVEPCDPPADLDDIPQGVYLTEGRWWKEV